MKFHGLLSLAFLLASTIAQTAPHIHDPTVLQDVLNRVRQVAAQGRVPNVIFDLDGTLLETGARKIILVREFAALEESRERFPEDCQKMMQYSQKELRYLLKDSLALLNVTRPDVLEAVEAYYRPRFLGNQYCLQDEPIAGAVNFVKALHQSGARIIYITGRDEPNMGKCTRENLVLRGFPVGERAELVLKPDRNISDLDFKRAIFAELKEKGEIVAGFENEPANQNLYFDSFPGIIGVMLDTSSAGDSSVTYPSARWVKDLLGVF